jgi:serine/threonine protein kinase
VIAERAMIGEVLGNYRVTARLGSGGMGEVFLAEHQRIARRAAIKVLNRDLTRNPQLLARFFDEARATSLVKSAGIVEIYDCDVDAAGRAYIVMEHLQGETLASRLRRHARLDWPQAVEIARQIALALGAAHDKGIVHRDLKPENIFLVGKPGELSVVAVKVLDFGIAKLLYGDPARPYQTAPGALVGTPEYMSPEQCCGIGPVDHRADIYALGCVMHRMIRGHAPFDMKRVREVISAHMFQIAPPLDQTAHLAPRWLSSLVARMLAKRPIDRPTSMAEVARELDHRRALMRRASALLWPSMGGRRSKALALAMGVMLIAGALWAGRMWRSGPSHAQAGEGIVKMRASHARQAPVPPPPTAVAPAPASVAAPAAAPAL